MPDPDISCARIFVRCLPGFLLNTTADQEAVLQFGVSSQGLRPPALTHYLVNDLGVVA